MSVQNLREKFNNPSNGTISPPGTCFGTLPTNKSQQAGPTTKTETFSTKIELSKIKTSPFGSSINDKRPTNFHSPMSSNRSSPSPDRIINSCPKPFVNGYAESKTIKKTPEQCQQDIISRKWKKNPTSTEPSDNVWNKNVPNLESPKSWTRPPFTPESSALSKPRSVISKFISLDSSSNNFDTSEIDGFVSNGTEKLRNTYEITCPNNVRSRMDEGVNTDNTSKNIAERKSPFCNGLNKSDYSAKWKPNNNNDVSENKNIQTNKVLLPTQDYSTLERKYHTLQKHHESLKRQFEEKNNQLDQLRKLSEAMYKEYDELRTQYKLETSAMHQAMGRAHEWYKQNRELKRQSTALLQYVMEKNPDGVPILKAGDQVDSFSDQDNEIEALRKTIKDFTKDMSKLQAELNSLKMKESEAQEQITYLNKQLETERRGKLSTYTLGQKRDQGDTFTKINQNDNLEEKLRATEFELQLALDRANQAEAESQILSNKVSELVNELQEFKNKTVPTIPTAPAAPPPPPPPPLPPSFSGGSGLNITKNVVPRKPVQINQTEVSAFDEVGNFLEMPKTSGIPKIQNGVIDNIVEAIKKGQYNLKTTERQSSTKKEESSEVEHEIKNILGTWKRQPKKKKDF